jgi:hypothetical protein
MPTATDGTIAAPQVAGIARLFDVLRARTGTLEVFTPAAPDFSALLFGGDTLVLSGNTIGFGNG